MTTHPLLVLFPDRLRMRNPDGSWSTVIEQTKAGDWISGTPLGMPEWDTYQPQCARFDTLLEAIEWQTERPWYPPDAPPFT